MDAFAELGLPRSTVVDASEMARRFDEISRLRHPDAGGDAEAFARLNEARRLLASPAARLRHLLELVAPGTRLDGALDPALMEIFQVLGPALQAAQDVDRRRGAAATALARALLASDAMCHRELLEAIAATIAERLEILEATAARWDGSVDALAAWAREAAFLEKWQSQVRDQLGRFNV